MSTHQPPVVRIDRISIFRVTKERTTRVGSFLDPSTGKRRTVGLGVVGEPLGPYLGHRNGVDVQLRKDSIDSVEIVEILIHREPNSLGKYPVKHVFAEDIDGFAPDFYADPYTDEDAR